MEIIIFLLLVVICSNFYNNNYKNIFTIIYHIYSNVIKEYVVEKIHLIIIKKYIVKEGIKYDNILYSLLSFILYKHGLCL